MRNRKRNISNENICSMNGSRVITSNNLKEKEAISQNRKKSEKNICERYTDFIEFNPETGMEWKAWLLYFEGCCRDIKKDSI